MKLVANFFTAWLPNSSRANVFLSWSASALAHVAVGGAIAGWGGSSVFWYSGSSSPQGNAFDSPARLAGAAVSSDQPPVTVTIVRAIAVPLPTVGEKQEQTSELAPQSTDLERKREEASLAIPSVEPGKLIEHLVSAEVTDVVIGSKASSSDEPQVDTTEEPAAAPKHGSRELAKPALGDHGSGPDDVDSMPSIAGAADPPSPFPSNPSPGYPAAAIRERRQGRVVVRMLVSAEGKVTSAEIQKSSGWPDVDAAALATAKSWKFTPARRDGQPVPHEYIKPWNFRIEN
jgi:protein TonB